MFFGLQVWTNINEKHFEPLRSRSHWCTSIVQGEQHSLIKARSVQVSRNGLPRPAVQLQLLWVRRVRVWLGQDVAIAVFVKRVLERVAVRRQALRCKQRVTGEQEKHRLKQVQLNSAHTHITWNNFSPACPLSRSCSGSILLLLLLAFGASAFARTRRRKATWTKTVA